MKPIVCSAPGESKWRCCNELRAGAARRVGVGGVNKRLLKPTVEGDEDGVHQAASVAHAGQEAPDIPGKQPVPQTWRE